MTNHNTPKIRKWKSAIMAWQESGLGVTEYCRRNNLSMNTFYGWRRKIQESNISFEGNFKELEFKSIASCISSTSSGIEILFLDGIKIKLHKGFDVSELKKTLKAFGVAPC